MSEIGAFGPPDHHDANACLGHLGQDHGCGEVEVVCYEDSAERLGESGEVIIVRPPALEPSHALALYLEDLDSRDDGRRDAFVEEEQSTLDRRKLAFKLLRRIDRRWRNSRVQVGNPGGIDAFVEQVANEASRNPGALDDGRAALNGSVDL